MERPLCFGLSRPLVKGNQIIHAEVPLSEMFGYSTQVRSLSSGRATYVAVTDDDALRGFTMLSRLEGIIPALETSHAIAWVIVS